MFREVDNLKKCSCCGAEPVEPKLFRGVGDLISHFSSVTQLRIRDTYRFFYVTYFLKSPFCIISPTFENFILLYRFYIKLLMLTI